MTESWETHDSTTYFAKEDSVPVCTWTKGRKFVMCMWPCMDSGDKSPMLRLRAR